MEAGFSARHVSFIETGRARPSKDALLVLAEALEVPLRERNRLLEAGGFAPLYRQTSLAADEMGHIRGLLQFIVDRHMPYAALVLDRYSNCLLGNAASSALARAVADPSLVTEHANFLRIAFHPLGARRFIVNWEDTSRHLLGRAERELGVRPDDEPAMTLLRELHDLAGPLERPRHAASVAPGDVLLPIHFRRDDLDVRIFSAIMTLGTPQDVTLQELRIETFFPADEVSERNWSRFLSS